MVRSVDTVVALSSGLPPSGIAVVRASGPHVPALVKAFGLGELTPRVAALRTVRSPSNGAVLDRALCLLFDEGASATGEAVLELHCHGSPALIERVLQDAQIVPGVRLADPGEFTMRAVLSGAMDLTSAEAMAELIEARTEAERRRATRLAGGAVARHAQHWRADLTSALALCEAALDFSDEGDVLVDTAAVDTIAATLAASLVNVLADSSGAERLSDGFHIVVAGPPNAGKSSLVNALAENEAALVSDEPGTTRDVISVPLVLAGYRVTLHDTAGVRSGASGVEALGIARTHERLAAADLVLEVRSPDTEPLKLADALVVHHKSDLAPAPAATLATSLDDASSLQTLRSVIAEKAHAGLAGAEAALLTRERQRRAVAGAVDHLEEAIGTTALELKAEGLRRAARSLGRLTGEIGIEDVLDDVFGRFCIGK